MECSRTVRKRSRKRLPGTSALVLLLLMAWVVSLRAGPNEFVAPPTDQQIFESQLKRYQDYSYEQLLDATYTAPDFVSELSFNPTAAKYFERIRTRLQLTEEEVDVYREKGFVLSDQLNRHSFGSAYYQIYSSDLPVLVTTDSILHALHRSYSNLLKELELSVLAPSITAILAECHEALAQLAGDSPTLETQLRDVDLYLTVARNLLAGAPARKERRRTDHWDDSVLVPSQLGQDEDVLVLLRNIQALKTQTQLHTLPTRIYGGERWIDYSQFKPRGHYPTSLALRRYFRCMMWLGRADCGFNVLPVDKTFGIRADSVRELQDAMLLSMLIEASQNVKQLTELQRIIGFLVGSGDSLEVATLLSVLDDVNVQSVDQIAAPAVVEQMQRILRDEQLGQQRIRSQAIVSYPGDPDKVPPPAIFQLFGQRFVLDSFLLSHLVFDSIIYKGQKQKRLMPRGLDVMAALGNNEAIPLLEAELKRWNYSANLLAARDFVESTPPELMEASLYNVWLDALRVLDVDMCGSAHAPQVMKTRTWQRKQLQTQLASWAELRHDNVLYAKMSYTAVPGCEYPAGYVEPYPSFFAKIALLSRTAAEGLQSIDYELVGQTTSDKTLRLQQKHVEFFRRMDEIMTTLESIARRELDAEPLLQAEEEFLTRVIDRRGNVPFGSGSLPRYDGWYCDLLYNGSPLKWDPTIVDVHTSPAGRQCLEVGVGDVNFCVIAVDNDGDVASYVGPVYSYYEFRQPSEQRLTDREWQRMIRDNKLPPRPGWAQGFLAEPKKRRYDGVSVSVTHYPTRQFVVSRSTDGKLREVGRADATDAGLRDLVTILKREAAGRVSLPLRGSAVTDAGLSHLRELLQLGLIDVRHSQVTAAGIQKLKRWMPKVAVLPEPLQVTRPAFCTAVAGFRRYGLRKSREFQPGEELLVYAELSGPRVHQPRVGGYRVSVAVRFEITEAGGRRVARGDLPAYELTSAKYPRPAHFVSYRIALPLKIREGRYQLRLSVRDDSAARTADASLSFLVGAGEEKARTRRLGGLDRLDGSSR